MIFPTVITWLGQPDIDPSRLGPKGKRKPEPRYRVEEWWPKRWSFIDERWVVIGSSRQLHEAENLLSKPCRWGIRVASKRRIVDTVTGEVMREELAK